MKNEEPIFKDNVQLQKYHGKGGWTYAIIDSITPHKGRPFGMRKVRGAIDTYTFDNYQLMPLGNGKLFLPVRAEIRKKIKKEAGDWVSVTLYSDEMPLPEEGDFMQCLKDEPQALKYFEVFTRSEQQKFLDWIAEARSMDQSVERMVGAINRILAGLRTPN